MADATQRAWVNKVLAVTLSPATLGANVSSAAAGAAGSRDEQGEEHEREVAVRRWNIACTDAVSQLESLTAAIRASGHARAHEAALMVTEVIKKLGTRPTTIEVLSDLEDYLIVEDVITSVERPNGFGIKVEIRKPLLAAVAGMRETLR
jgi:hypothetical protein